MSVSGCALKFDIFLTHDWGFDELERDNHERVVRVARALITRGFTVWIDADELYGDITTKMCEGIDESLTVGVFITQRYAQKVASKDDDNCKKEFRYAMKKRGEFFMIPIVMEQRMSDPASWDGRLGMELSDTLYVAMWDDSDGQFNDAVEKLASEIQKRKNSSRQRSRSLSSNSSVSSTASLSNCSTRVVYLPGASTIAESASDDIIKPPSYWSSVVKRLGNGARNAVCDERVQVASLVLGLIFTIVALAENSVGRSERITDGPLCPSVKSRRLTFFDGVIEDDGDDYYGYNDDDGYSNDDHCLPFKIYLLFDKAYNVSRGAGALCVLATLLFFAVLVGKFRLSQSLDFEYEGRAQVCVSLMNVLGLIFLITAFILMMYASQGILVWKWYLYHVPSSPIFIIFAIILTTIASWTDVVFLAEIMRS